MMDITVPAGRPAPGKLDRNTSSPAEEDRRGVSPDHNALGER